MLKLNAEIYKALEAEDVRARLTANGIDIPGGTPQRLADYTSRVANWQVDREAGIRRMTIEQCLFCRLRAEVCASRRLGMTATRYARPPTRCSHRNHGHRQPGCRCCRSRPAASLRQVVMAPEIRRVRDVGAVALIDGGGGFGEAPATRAIDLAVEKAKAFGIGAVAVRNSNHYGAAGVHALRATAHGLVGISTSAVWDTAIVPTFGARRCSAPTLSPSRPPRGASAILLACHEYRRDRKLNLATWPEKRCRVGCERDVPRSPMRRGRFSISCSRRSRRPRPQRPQASACRAEEISRRAVGSTYSPLRDKIGRYTSATS